MQDRATNSSRGPIVSLEDLKKNLSIAEKKLNASDSNEEKIEHWTLIKLKSDALLALGLRYEQLALVQEDPKEKTNYILLAVENYCQAMECRNNYDDVATKDKVFSLLTKMNTAYDDALLDCDPIKDSHYGELIKSKSDILYKMGDVYERLAPLQPDAKSKSKFYTLAIKYYYQAFECNRNQQVINKLFLLRAAFNNYANFSKLDDSHLPFISNEDSISGVIGPEDYFLQAFRYASGIGVRKNVTKAMAALKYAAKLNYAPAAFVLGRCLQKKGMIYLERAADQGYVPAQACYWEQSVYAKKINDKALTYLKSAANKGDPDAEMRLAIYNSINDESLSAPNSTALEWITRANQQGYAVSQYRYGCGVLNGEIRDQTKIPQAVEWLYSAAIQEEPNALMSIGELFPKHYISISAFNPYWASEIVRADVVKTASLAEIGLAGAQYRYGIMYVYGKHGITQNRNKGIRWLRLAVRQKHSEACRALEVLYSWEKGPTTIADIAADDLETTVADLAKGYRVDMKLGILSAEKMLKLCVKKNTDDFDCLYHLTMAQATPTSIAGVVRANVLIGSILFVAGKEAARRVGLRAKGPIFSDLIKRNPDDFYDALSTDDLLTEEDRISYFEILYAHPDHAKLADDRFGKLAFRLATHYYEAMAKFPRSSHEKNELIKKALSYFKSVGEKDENYSEALDAIFLLRALLDESPQKLEKEIFPEEKSYRFHSKIFEPCIARETELFKEIVAMLKDYIKDDIDGLPDQGFFARIAKRNYRSEVKAISVSNFNHPYEILEALDQIKVLNVDDALISIRQQIRWMSRQIKKVNDLPKDETKTNAATTSQTDNNPKVEASSSSSSSSELSQTDIADQVRNR